LRFPLDVLNVGNVFFTNGNAASNYAIMMNRVDRIFVNWRDNVIPVGGKYSDDKGPVHFIDPHSYCGFSRPIFNNWNSEILIEDFVPMEFCDGIYEAKTGEPVTCFHEQLKRVKARNG
jgi:hypothetical protein